MEKIGILGVPWMFHEERQGVALAPYAIRYTGVIGMLEKLVDEVVDYHNMAFFTDMEQEAILKSKDLKAITYKAKELREIVADMKAEEGMPIVFGGDQLISLSSIAGMGDDGAEQTIIWVNAHADMGRELKQDNLCHNVMATVIGRGPKELGTIMNQRFVPGDNVCIVGTRRMDYDELRLIEEEKILHYDMTKIDRIGFAMMTDEIVQWLAKKNGNVHLVLDVDAIDPEFTPGTDFISQGGIYWREIRYFMKNLALSDKVDAMTFVGINPLNDDKNKTSKFVTSLLEEYFQVKNVQIDQF
ncbi:arginase family protein [Listeria cornellensis]|uniref:Arginase n=1 Tax=Listeria cornellensis FSL F6-0969 TaxID=1265820 RepID=W7C4U9_9LIST|nr:arginase family protein [Listeria cornellensis]EUJ32250.1 arginase [Listeria cornellensis FSL F6-0969]